MWLFGLFLAVPLIEIALFIQVGGAIGLFPTLAVVILTAILGTALVRGQGLQALANLKSSFNELNDPTEPLAHGAMILFAGALLLTPGFFTDAVGFALLVPGFRNAAIQRMRSKIKTTGFTSEVHQNAKPANGSSRETIIEGDFEPVGDPETRSGPSGWTQH